MKMRYHDLRKYAIEGLRNKAGYIPPQFAPDAIPANPRLLFTHIHYNTYIDYYRAVVIGDVVSIVVYVFTCWNCRHALNRIHETVWITTLLEVGEPCECCGEVRVDEIPF